MGDGKTVAICEIYLCLKIETSVAWSLDTGIEVTRRFKLLDMSPKLYV